MRNNKEEDGEGREDRKKWVTLVELEGWVTARTCLEMGAGGVSLHHHSSSHWKEPWRNHCGRRPAAGNMADIGERRQVTWRTSVSTGWKHGGRQWQSAGNMVDARGKHGGRRGHRQETCLTPSVNMAVVYGWQQTWRTGWQETHRTAGNMADVVDVGRKHGGRSQWIWRSLTVDSKRGGRWWQETWRTWVTVDRKHGGRRKETWWTSVTPDWKHGVLLRCSSEHPIGKFTCCCACGNLCVCLCLIHCGLWVLNQPLLVWTLSITVNWKLLILLWAVCFHASYSAAGRQLPAGSCVRSSCFHSNVTRRHFCRFCSQLRYFVKPLSVVMMMALMKICLLNFYFFHFFQ